MQFRCQDDANIWQEVYTNNEYQLPEDMTDWRVLDIGAHVGAFSRLCLDRGACVSAFEPCLSAMNCLEVNMGPHWGKLSRHRVAVTHEFGTAYLRHRISNTGVPIPSGNSPLLMLGEGEHIATVPLTFALKAQSYWNLVKMDIEGCEYEAIDAAPSEALRLSPLWIVESHKPGRHEELLGMFTAAGFTARTAPKEHGYLLCWFTRDK